MRPPAPVCAALLALLALLAAPAAEPALRTPPTWTPIQLREIIRAAESNPTITALPGPALFPHLPGRRVCRIPAGGIVAGGHVTGHCRVSVAGSHAAPVVTFAEQWSGSARVDIHTWRIALRHAVPVLIGESGAPPPQSWG